MMAESLFNDYTAAAVGIVFLIGVLVAILIGGGLLVLNLSLLSKRKEDHVGEVSPSEVGFLRTTVWPDEGSSDRYVLPAMDDEEEEDTGDKPKAVPQNESPPKSEAEKVQKRVA